MKRYEVRLDNTPTGFVEALAPSAAVDMAYASFDVGRKALSLHRDSGAGMHVLIDTTNNRAIARHDSHRALAALAYIQFANCDTVIVRAGLNKHFSIFTVPQMKGIATSLGLIIEDGTSYSDMLKTVRAALESLDWLALPFTTEQLEQQAFALHPTDARPYAFNAQAREPELLDKWHFEPQRNRKRIDSSHGHEFAAGLGYGPGVVPPEAGAAPAAVAAPSRPSARPAPHPKAEPGTPTAPKPPRAPAAPGARPKAGTSTGKVWDIADGLKAKHKGELDKVFRASVIKACEAEGINASTASVQFGKWKASL